LLFNSGGWKITREMIARNLVQVCERITPGIIESAWHIHKSEWTENRMDSSAKEGPDD
jgi:hypothetical protein